MEKGAVTLYAECYKYVYLSLNMINMDKTYPSPNIYMKSMMEATAYGREDKVAVIHFLEQNHRIIKWLGT